MTIHIHISEVAQSHFCHLIDKEGVQNLALRIFLDNPGSPLAEVGISFCPPGEEKPTDLMLSYDSLTVYIDKLSAPFLDEADIDYKTDELGGQLSISAPKIKGAKPTSEAGLFERVTYILETEINPNLAHHGGMVKLVEITADNALVLQFGGGCQGCGMVDVTLKQGIERTLMEQLPEITAIIDSTDHTSGDNPYYSER